MPHNKEQLKKVYQELPEEIQNIMASMDTVEAITTIGQKHQLHIDKIGDLSDEIGLTMLGLTKLNEFVSNIKNRLQINQNTAEQITREINEQIFLPVRQALQELQTASDARADTDNGVGTIPFRPTAPEPDTLPDKDKLLDEIERPKTEEDTVFEKKLGTLFRIPREEVDLDDPYLEKPE